MVYWTENDEPKSKGFGPDSIDQTLKYCEELRKQARDGKNISHIATGTENPNCTSLHGVDVVSSDYDWKKRRK
jgi:hypothetical protein